MLAKLAQHPLVIAAMLCAGATGAMGFAAIPTGEPKLAYEMTSEITAESIVLDDGINKALYKEAVATSAKLDQHVECLAKVIVHEAGNQPRTGQLAVAQLVMNRVGKPKFGDTVCGVINQRGQFFQTASYNPRRDTPRWANAVEIARQAIAGDGEQVVPGAYFYHAVHQPPNRFFRTRERISMVGDHVFYR